MTTAQVVKTLLTVNNSPIHDYIHQDHHTLPTKEMTPEFKPFTVYNLLKRQYSSYYYVTFFFFTKIYLSVMYKSTLASEFKMAEYWLRSKINERNLLPS